MRRLLPAFALLIATAMGASAATAQVVEHSGRTFHMAVCARTIGLGEARCHAHVVTDRSGNILANLDRGGRPLATRNAAPAGYGPADLQGSYGLKNLSSTSGGTMTIAIVDAYGYSNAERDLGIYRSQFVLPPCTTANGCFKKVNQNGVQGSYPRNNTGWAQEQALDLDMVSAICPNCHILLVEASSATYGNLATAENTAVAMGAHAISNSYGGSETGSQSYEAAYNHAGIAITVSTGDSGYGVQFPASSPHVTAVGGTTLVGGPGGRVSETAWSGGGSGCSSIYAKPTWQTDPLCKFRMEADTSAVADPNTGVAVYGPVFSNISGWEVFGGTSVSSPLTAAIYGLNGGVPLIPQNEVPYQNQSSLYDVQSGSNGSCGGTYLCTASSPANPNGNGGTTYDGPTGLGTPNGDAAF